MPGRQPKPISASQRRVRLQRIVRIARGLGFVGRIEYQHVSTDSGGARYGIGPSADEDLLTVFDKAFQRDADAADYSLEAIIAHERGHQLIVRHPYLSQQFAKWGVLASEEILASVLGSVIAQEQKDQDDLMLKAIGEAAKRGLDPELTFRNLVVFKSCLRQIL